MATTNVVSREEGLRLRHEDWAATHGGAGPGHPFGKRTIAKSGNRGGKRTDLGDRYYRSAYESNYHRYLLWLKGQGSILACVYEPCRFLFTAQPRRRIGGKKRPLKGLVKHPGYLPDFSVTESDGAVIFVEVKGWMDARSRATLGHMARYYPDVRIVVVDRAAYKDIERACGHLISGWE